MSEENEQCPHLCTCCDSVGKFKPVFYRQNSICPNCGSGERHRALAIHLRHYTYLLNGANVLHFAPEPPITNMILRSIKDGCYTISDLKSNNVREHIDITNTKLPDSFYSFVVLCHVLEHIPDDKKALRELYRITAPNAKILLMVPLIYQYHLGIYKRIDGTEMPHIKNLDPDITFSGGGVERSDPNVLLELFGQSDHVRIYGRQSLKECCEKIGFHVDISSPFCYDDNYRKRVSIMDDVFILTKV